MRLSVPEYIDLDEYEARLLLAIELYREGRPTLSSKLLNSLSYVSRISCVSSRGEELA